MKTMKIQVPVIWLMSGYVEVEANSIEAAINNFNPDDHGLPKNGIYVDSSFELATTDEDEFITLEDVRKD